MVVEGAPLVILGNGKFVSEGFATGDAQEDVVSFASRGNVQTVVVDIRRLRQVVGEANAYCIAWSSFEQGTRDLSVIAEQVGLLIR